MVLADAVANELRTRKILLPTVALIEKILCHRANPRRARDIPSADRRSDHAHRAALDAVSLVRPGGSSSSLSWFRQPPGAPSANAVLAHLARLRAVRALDLPADLGRDVHQNRLLRLAREGAQTAVFQLQEYGPLRRYATLVAILLDTMATLTDETLDLHDRLIGTFFSKVRSKYDREFAADCRALNDKIRLYAKIGSALIAAKEAKTDPFAAIEDVIPWEEFTASVSQAEKLSRDEAFDPLTLLTDYFSTLRKYAPSFLKTFQFRGPPVAQSLLDAIDLPRSMNHSGARKIPATAPLGFVPPRWARSVGAGEEIDRRFYELCALSELKNRLRAGDLHVVGSRQFLDIGRLERTLFTLKWLRDPALRRRVTGGLNKGEARNALARTVFFHRLGEIRDRSYENQRYRASGLNLVIAAITLWYTVYLERTVNSLRERGTVNDDLLGHLAPLGWNHIGLTGDYNWHANKRVAKGGFRPLRRVRSMESTVAAP